MDKKTSLKMIEELSNAYGASGFEDEVLLVGRKYGEGLARIEENSIRDLFFYRNENTGDKPVILLDGHSDEVGFMVQAIKPNGTLQFIPLGGWVENTVPAHKVKVRNAEGKYISGIVASKPPHFMSSAEKGQNLPISAMVIDVGATSKEEVINDFKIRVGAPVVPDVTMEYNEKNDVMLGKAYDCRLGCACVIETLKELQGEQLDVDVVGVFSTQEEVGTRGAQVAAQTVKPDIAIVFEGSPADDTFTPDYLIQTALGKGPMLRHIDARMITNPRFIRYAIDLGEELGIPVQEAVRTGGSTNGAPIHLSNMGVPVIVVGLPVRYIHTHHCYASFCDFENSVKLAVEIIKRLNGDIIKSF
ncbi:MAG: M20/M25/M40 family metallo-hydrolase [Oscillospiraceae bacterium]|nr:M20/M25/M40 family metallo-hydrolase [Oscillospiraceae bacterium]